MSLFEDNRYMYRDTFFVFFQHRNRPTSDSIEQALKKMGDKYQAKNFREVDGKFESVTIYSPQDYSAMDIVCVEGDDVREQTREILAEFQSMTLTGEDRTKLKQLSGADCRYDVFHFGQVTDSNDDEDDFLDPGGLMAVMDRLSEISQGVSYDPQSQTLF
jgi:hypothetical protein